MEVMLDLASSGRFGKLACSFGSLLFRARRVICLPGVQELLGSLRRLCRRRNKFEFRLLLIMCAVVAVCCALASIVTHIWCGAASIIIALRPSVPSRRNRRLQVGKRKVQLLSAMDDYNRDATWKIIGKGAAQLSRSEDAFMCTNCAYRVKIESDRAHMPFVSAAENRELDKLMVRRPWKLFGASSVCIRAVRHWQLAGVPASAWDRSCHGPKPRRPNPPPTPSRQFPMVQSLGCNAEIAA